MPSQPVALKTATFATSTLTTSTFPTTMVATALPLTSQPLPFPTLYGRAGFSGFPHLLKITNHARWISMSG